LNDLSTIPGSRACVCWSVCGKHQFILKYSKQGPKNPKIEIGQNVNYFAETGSNGFITVECNVFLDFDVIPAVFEKLLKSQITILGRNLSKNAYFGA